MHVAIGEINDPLPSWAHQIGAADIPFIWHCPVENSGAAGHLNHG